MTVSAILNAGSARIARSGSAYADQSKPSFDQILANGRRSASSDAIRIDRSTGLNDDRGSARASSPQSDRSAASQPVAATSDHDVQPDRPAEPKRPESIDQAVVAAEQHVREESDNPSTLLDANLPDPPVDVEAEDEPDSGQDRDSEAVSLDESTTAHVSGDVQTVADTSVHLTTVDVPALASSAMVVDALKAHQPDDRQDSQAVENQDMSDVWPQPPLSQDEKGRRDQDAVMTPQPSVSQPQPGSANPAVAVVVAGKAEADKLVAQKAAVAHGRIAGMTGQAIEAQDDVVLVTSGLAGESGRERQSSDSGDQPNSGNPRMVPAVLVGQQPGGVATLVAAPLDPATGLSVAQPVGATPPQATVGGVSPNPVPLPDSEQTPSDANVLRVLRGMRGVLHQNGGAMTLRLSPPEMGIVRIQMQIQHGTVSAMLHTEHESARTLLTQQLTELRHALESQGLTVDKLGVQAMSQDGSSSSTHKDSDGSAGDGRSRGHLGPGGRQAGDRDGRQDDAQGGPGQQAETFEAALNMVG